MSILDFSKIFGPSISAFTSKSGLDFHFDKSTPTLTAPQKAFLKKNLKTKDINLFNIQQIRGKRVVGASLKQKKIPKADAAITGLSNVILSVRTADCVPIFLFDPKTKALGIVHAGWRSTHKKIVINTIKKLKSRYHVDPQNLKAVLGPCLQKCCYEVNKNFLRRFPGYLSQKDRKFYLDLTKANREQLVQAGVLPRNIYDCKCCTFCGKTWYSYRRKGLTAGRMLSVIMRKE